MIGLCLRANNLVGQLGPMDLPNIVFINLFNNALSGTLPREWSSWTKIELLYVAWCKVVGCGMAIPWFFDALSRSLVVLWVTIM